MTTWQPISTAGEAKRHGQRVLLYIPLTHKGTVIGRWCRRPALFGQEQQTEAWWVEGFDLGFPAEGDYAPTHWQPIMEKPQEG